jgi:hypothetical protein
MCVEDRAGPMSECVKVRGSKGKDICHGPLKLELELQQEHVWRKWGCLARTEQR